MKKPHQLANESYDNYMATFAEVYEHSPWIIEQSYELVKEDVFYDDYENFHKLLSSIVLNANQTNQESLILAHPMLAGKKAQKNELTDFSTNEQKSAGLDSCSEDEITLFDELNAIYFEKFGFPFIIAVKGKTKENILHSFKKRIENKLDDERLTALHQINKIAMIRIKGIYDN